MARLADWRIKILVVRAARVAPAHVVNRAKISVHECAIQKFVAQHLTVRPGIDRGLSEPKAVSAEAAVQIRFTDADETFVRGCICRKTGCRGVRMVVGRLDIERDQGAGYVAGN